jgi:hypothetical protein
VAGKISIFAEEAGIGRKTGASAKGAGTLMAVKVDSPTALLAVESFKEGFGW